MFVGRIKWNYFSVYKHYISYCYYRSSCVSSPKSAGLQEKLQRDGVPGCKDLEEGKFQSLGTSGVIPRDSPGHSILK